MAQTFPQVRIVQLVTNLHEHIQQISITNPQTQMTQPALGKQTPSLSARMALFMPDTELLLGHQNYDFGDTPIPPNEDHKELPPFTAIVTPEIAAAVIAAIEGAVDAQVPTFSMGDEAKATGPRQWTRVNRLVVNLPYKDPANQYIQAFVGIYRDPECKRQDVEAGFVIGFVHDEFLTQRFGAEANIATLRKENNLFSLTDFLVDPSVGEAFGATATNLFSTLKACVNNWADISVQTILARFAETMAAIATKRK